MNGQYVIYGFQFQNDLISYNEINLVSTIEFQSLVRDGKLNLSPKFYPSQVQFVAQAFLVGRFQEARTQMAVNLDGGTYDRAGARIFAFCAFSVPLWLRVSSSLPCHFI